MAFKVVTASAGSGKTATLVSDYLTLIIRRPTEFAHILALTFTNKAAAEMKERIMSYLDELSAAHLGLDHATPRFLIETLRDSTRLSDTEIYRRAYEARKLILHQYDQFHISTIDSFEHRIVKTFAHDLNLPQHFEVELEENVLLEIAVAGLIDLAGTDAELTKALLDFASEKALEDKDWSVQGDLLKTSKKLFREDSQHFVEQIAHMNRERLLAAKENILTRCAIIEATIKNKAEAAYKMIEVWPVEHFSYKRTGFYNIIQELASGKKSRILGPIRRLEEVIENQSLFGKGDKKNIPAELLSIENAILNELVEVLNYLEHIRPRYSLLIKVRAQIHQVILLSEVQNHLNALREERQTIHISEFNKRISKVIRNQPEPFIYERTGHRYRHIFIDEFQDTSVLQWFNIIPLMENSLANGGEGLVVGDPKQAIYRFRNGEVELFTNLPKFPSIREFPTIQHQSPIMEQMLVESPLVHNYRSFTGLVEFNNAFFGFCSEKLPEQVQSAYSNIGQQPRRGNQTGQVGMLLLEEDTKALLIERTKVEILSLIDTLLEKGYKLGNIAILLRDNKTAAEIATYLLEHDISVTSPESMLLTNSPQVRFLLDLLRLLNDNEDQIAAAGVGMYLHNLGICGAMSLLDVFDRMNRPLIESLQGLFDELGILIQLDELLNFGIYEACEKALQALYSKSAFDPFLLGFLDHVLERVTNRQESLSELMEWFDKHPDLSIPLPPGPDSVRVMTIHKSKGLEFPIVIYPALQPSHGNTKRDAWVDLAEEGLPATLVTLSKNSLNPYLQDLYLKENAKSELDELNVNYVAFTRAADCLYILTPLKSSDDSMQINSLLRQYLDREAIKYNAGEWTFIGELPKPSIKHEEMLSIPPAVVERSSWAERTHLVLEQPSPERQWGNLMHLFLSKLTDADSFQSDLRQFAKKYDIPENQVERMERTTLRLLEMDSLTWLFSREGVHRSEVTISLEAEYNLRPDRVLFKDGEAWLADFKTGDEKEAHKEQIERYASALENAGFPVTKKQLIYLGEEIKVTSL